jgi:regulator of nucleoside diphosphate kinase
MLGTNGVWVFTWSTRLYPPAAEGPELQEGPGARLDADRAAGPERQLQGAHAKTLKLDLKPTVKKMDDTTAKASLKVKVEAPMIGKKTINLGPVDIKKMAEPKVINKKMGMFRVRLSMQWTGEEMVFTVVFPTQANADQHRISVLAPLGTAVLGYRAGDSIEWVVPGRTRRVRIENVLYQPEAASSASREGDEGG